MGDSFCKSATFNSGLALPRFSGMQKMTQQHREEKLVARLLVKERSAYDSLYDQYSAALYGVAFRMLKEEAIAQDVLQETFIKVWRKIHTYDPAKGRFFTWLLNILKNLAIDKMRSKEVKYAAKKQSYDAETLERYAPTVSIAIEHIGLREIVQNLPDKQREIIMLIYFDGYTHVEAAEELDLPLGTVKSRIRLAMNRLRGEMQ